MRLQTDPFIIKRGASDYTGFSFDLLQALAKRLRFNFKLRDVTDTQQNGDYDLLVNELIKGVSVTCVRCVSGFSSQDVNTASA